MSFSKGRGQSSGNLRDFRIDSLSGQSPMAKAQSQPQGASIKEAPQPPARQEIKARQTSVSEWDQETEAFDADKMWKVWEEDLETSLKPEAPQVPIQDRSSVSLASTVAQSAVSLSPSAVASADTTTYRGPQPWAVELAQTESRMERRGEVEYSNSFKKQELLKAQTAEFMAQLRQELGHQIEIFNESRHSGAHAVHLYRITNTEQDFMLFRNGVKLVVSGQRSGRILFAFNQFLGQIYATQQNPHFELEAQWGAFDQLLWTYKNERVQLEDVVRFFLTEFVRQSYK